MPVTAIYDSTAQDELTLGFFEKLQEKKRLGKMDKFLLLK